MYLQCRSNIEKNYNIWHLDRTNQWLTAAYTTEKDKKQKSLELNSQQFPFLVNIAGGSWIDCTILFSQDGLILASFIFVFSLTLTLS